MMGSSHPHPQTITSSNAVIQTHPFAERTHTHRRVYGCEAAGKSWKGLRPGLMEISRVGPMCKSGKTTWTHIRDGRDRTWRTPAVPGSVSGAPPPGERRMHQEFPGVQSGRHHLPVHQPTPSMDLWIHRVPRARVRGE